MSVGHDQGLKTPAKPLEDAKNAVGSPDQHNGDERINWSFITYIG